jgi:CheY-like chemotaxis protein
LGRPDNDRTDRETKKTNGITVARILIFNNGIPLPNQNKILVVEDFNDSRKLFVLYLSSLGFDVFEASNGREALDRAVSIAPDLIIMDITMPHMDGHEATLILKSNPDTQHIPILVATAHTGNAHQDGIRAAGASEVLLKPVDFGVLREMLGRYLHCQADTLSTFASLK